VVSQRQWRALGVFFITALGLFLVPGLVLGNWLGDWVRTLALYVGYNRAPAPLSWLAMFIPSPLAIVLSAVGVILGMGYFLWFAVRMSNLPMLLGFGILLTLLIVPLPSVYDLTLALFPWLVCWHALTDRRGARLLLGSLPILSWLMILITPEYLGTEKFDVVMADKLLVSVLLLAVFVYALKARRGTKDK
jgi:hypothetical protein